MSWAYARYQEPNANRLASGLFFRIQENEHPVQPPLTRSPDLALRDLSHDHFVIPEYRQTKQDRELYLPLLEVLVEVEAVGTIAWTTLTQTFTNRASSPVTEATYCFPLYDKSTVTSFSCCIGSEKVLKGVVKPKALAKAEFEAAVARQHVAALLEEHTPEVFETSIGNIPAQTSVKIEVCYITELKADLSGDGILLTIPTSVAPRYGTPPSSLATSTARKSLAVPPENGLQIRIQVSSPVAINRIESRTHPVTIEMGSHGHTTTKNIRDLAKARTSLEYDPTKARATLSDRTACLGKDFVLLIESRGGTLLASRAILESHPKLSNYSALMVSINLKDMYTPNVVSLKSPSEIIFLADRSGSMVDKIEALKTAMGFFLKSLPNNCSFNICSFGSNHALMWSESRPYNQASLDEAMSYINNFRADMGGTELLSGLRSVVEKADPVLSTQIITLTDGEVWNAAGIFEFIRDSKAARGKDSIRFFALGIGDAVSHHLIEGIGRNGGGLAEVVSVDSAGDWKSRVIRMLEAALTPSTWKVEINLGGFPKNEQEGLCIQAPNRIPDFHAFSRSSVYFLLSEEAKFESVNIIATATSGETITAELPVQILENTRNCVHLLAAKGVLNDFESGQSWFHGSVRSTETKSEAEIEDRMRVEAERIGIEWSLSSRWTSFVVVDNNASLEKASRWYQAERSELADLTRPRYGSYGYYQPSGNFPMYGPAMSSKAATRSFPENVALGGILGSTSYGFNHPPETPNSQTPSWSTRDHKPVLRRSSPKGKRQPGWESIPGSESPTHTFAAPSVSFGPSPDSFPDSFTSNDKKPISPILKPELGDHISQQSSLLDSNVLSATEAFPSRQRSYVPETSTSAQSMPANDYNSWLENGQLAPISSTRAPHRESPLNSLGSVEPASLKTANTSNPQVGDLYYDFHDFQPTSSKPLTPSHTTSQENFLPSQYPSFYRTSDFDFAMGHDSLPKSAGDEELMPAPEFNRSVRPRIASATSRDSHAPSTPLSHEEERQKSGNAYRNTMPKLDRTMTDTYADELYNPSFQITKKEIIPPELPPGSRKEGLKSVRSASTTQRPSSQAKDATPSTELSLENLVDAQTAEGSFKLNDELPSALKRKFTNWKWEVLLSELDEEVLFEDLNAVLDTTQAVLYIETVYPQSRGLWGLVMQKALGFIIKVVASKEARKSIWLVLGKQLSDGRKGAMDALQENRWRLEDGAYSKLTRIVDLLLELDVLLMVLRKVIKPYERSVQTARFKLQDLVSRLDEERVLGSPLLPKDLEIQGIASEEQIDSGKQIEDPDDWSDGWDVILKLSQAIRLVMKEKGYPGY